MRTATLVATALFASLPLFAQAAPYTTLDAEQSQLSFQYSQMGVPMQGKFTQFSGDISFDPAAPDAASADITVEVSGIDTGSTDGDLEVVTPAWLNVEQFPDARFVATSVVPDGEGRFRVEGDLTVKGTTQQLSVPVTFTEKADGHAVLEGKVRLERGAFKVGEGAWSTYDIVANEVDVVVQLAVSR